MVDEALAKLVGKTIRAVVMKARRDDPRRFMQVFLIFTDGTYYELYSTGELVTTSDTDDGDIDEVRKYMAQSMGVIFEAEHDDFGSIIVRTGIDLVERVYQETELFSSSPLELPVVTPRTTTYLRWNTPREKLLALLDEISTNRSAELIHPDFSEIDLSCDTLYYKNFTGYVFDRANLASTDFTHSNLGFSSFISADCSAALFRHADLEMASFTHTRLVRADFSYAKLLKANLQRADLSEAIFSHADLRNADLSGAKVFETDFSYADLRGANLQGVLKANADFTGAKM